LSSGPPQVVELPDPRRAVPAEISIRELKMHDRTRGMSRRVGRLAGGAADWMHGELLKPGVQVSYAA